MVSRQVGEPENLGGPGRSGQARQPEDNPATAGHAHVHAHEPGADPVSFWEARYEAQGQMWSGRVNSVLAEQGDALAPGRALDVGCGEGADSIWLARRGWRVEAVNISPTAVARVAAAAAAAGVADLVQAAQIDLEHELPTGEFDLISAQFFQSPLEFPRDRVLRDLAGLLAPGGRLLLVDHGTTPPWGGHHDDLPTLEQTLASLALDPTVFAVKDARTRERDVTGRQGQQAHIVDNVIVARRR